MKQAAIGAFGDNVIGFVDFQLSKVVKLVHWSAIPSFYMDEERGCLEWM